MKREKGKHGHNCRNNKTQKCCGSCRAKVVDKGEIFNVTTNTQLSLNKCKNWEILNELKEDITCRKNYETQINGFKICYSVTHSRTLQTKEYDYLVEVPQNTQNIFQQRQGICGRRYKGERERNKIKHKNHDYKLDMSVY
eukprot:gene2695-3891_t